MCVCVGAAVTLLRLRAAGGPQPQLLHVSTEPGHGPRHHHHQPPPPAAQQPPPLITLPPQPHLAATE